MRTQPSRSELDPDAIQIALHTAWALPPVSLEYRPLGFGSHHWLADSTLDPAQRWFVTVDASRSSDPGGEQLARSLSTAWSLRHEANLDCVVAPLATRAGDMLAPIHDGRWFVSLFPFHPVIESPEWGAPQSTSELAEVQRLVAAIHQATPRVGSAVPRRFDFAIPFRAELDRALSNLEQPWKAGPYSERARSLLASRVESVREAFARYDHLADVAGRDGSEWVITHGEPHPGNVVRREDTGDLIVVDWDTCALAPRERDLWQLLGDATDPTAALEPYVAESGQRELSTTALDLFRLAWDLGEVAIYVDDFRAPHEETEDTLLAWQGFNESLSKLADGEGH